MQAGSWWPQRWLGLSVVVVLVLTACTGERNVHAELPEQLHGELLSVLSSDDIDAARVARVFDELGGDGTVAAIGSLPSVSEDTEELGRLQARFGQALALATDPASPNAVNVTPGSPWLEQFQRAGRQRFDLSAEAGSAVGYQLVGTVLRSGRYSEAFLTEVGADLLAAVRAESGAFTVPTGALEGFRLNYVDVTGAGFDPVSGLMIALEANPAAAREFFDPHNEDERIGLLLGRQAMDLRPRDDDVYVTSGQHHVLDALAAATDGRSDGVGLVITGEVLYRLGSNEARDLAHDAARDSMGRLLEGQWPAVHEAYSSPGGYLVNVDSGPQMQRLNRVITDVGRSPEAFASLLDSAAAYAALAMHRKTADAEVDVEERLDVLVAEAQSLIQVFAQLYSGRVDALDDGDVAGDADYDTRLGFGREFDGDAVSAAAGRVPEGDVTRAVLDDIVAEAARVDDAETSEIDDFAVEMRDDFGPIASAVAWQNQVYEGQVDVPPGELFDADGRPIPFAEMGEDQFVEYRDWARGLRTAAVLSLRPGEISNAYWNSVENALEDDSW